MLWIGAHPRPDTGNSEAAALLHETQGEEKEADTKLNDLAENMINEEAAGAGGGVSGQKTRRTPAPKTRTAGH
jgi:hypothetical protein